MWQEPLALCRAQHRAENADRLHRQLTDLNARIAEHLPIGQNSLPCSADRCGIAQPPTR